MPLETTIALLLAAASAVAIAARRLRLPYTVALVVAGLALGALRVTPVPHLTRELLYAVFLPGLLFEAAFHLDTRHLGESWRAIALLAFPGAALGIGATAGLLVLLGHAPGLALGLPWQGALCFAALLGATDPIAVVALFRSLGAPARLGVVIEGESLLNDGTAAVFFTLALELAQGPPPSVGHLALGFAWLVAGGLLIGALSGLVIALVAGRVGDPFVELTLTTTAAYGSFALAEQAHVSGLLATVAAGTVCGHHAASRRGGGATFRIVDAFWEYVAFALNSVVFLLIGLEVRIGALLALWAPIVAAYVVLHLARAALVGGTSVALSATSERWPWRWAAVLSWGGLRGALSMVLALSLPEGFPGRTRIVEMTFGVVLLSLLVNGLTTAPLLRALGLAGASEGRGRPAGGRAP